MIRRLPRYYRILNELLRNHICRVSSKELSERMGLTASQIRQDLNCFGGFGQQGYGYNVELLHNEIGNILGLNRGTTMVLIGAGRLGSALAAEMDFEYRGFHLTGIFDIDPHLFGKEIRGLPVQSMEELDAFCQKQKPDVAMLCIPKNQAYDVVEHLLSLGITGFWNFSHYDIAFHFPGVVNENVHLGDSLMTLCYQIQAQKEEELAQKQESGYDTLKK